MNKKRKMGKRFKAAGVCLGLAVTGAAPLHTISAWAADDDRVGKLEQENQDLHKRLDTLEALAQKEGLLPSGTTAPQFVAATSSITLSGFVTASYFHDSSEPPASIGHISPGYLWNRVNDNFTLNKIKLTLASPAVQNTGEKFDVGYRASLIYGQDAPIVNSGFNGGAATVGTNAPGFGFNAVREAFIEMNVPIGTGLDVRVGELISLLNYESGDGGAANNNFSQGYQWFFTGNGPSTGVQLGYSFTDWLNVKFRVQNGLYAGPVDNNSSKTFLGSINLTPTKNLWINLIGFGGREDAFAQSVVGGSLLAGWQATQALSFGTELDYFDFYNAPNGSPVRGIPRSGPPAFGRSTTLPSRWGWRCAPSS